MSETNSNQPKNNFLNLAIIITLFSFLALTVLIGGSVVYFQYLKYRSDARTSKIDILGISEQKIKYDKLTMGFVVSKTGTDSSELNKSVDELTVKAQDILTKNSIKKENIQTVKNSYPAYTDLNIDGTPAIRPKNTVFEVRFTIKIDNLQSNLSLPNTLTNELTAIGVNQFDSYNYEIANQKALCDDLKTAAIQNAREKGVKQIKAIGGNEIVSTQIQAGNDDCAGGMYSMPYATFDKISAIPDQAKSTSPEIVTGEKTMTQQVSVTFEYR
jgi:uncharacterized protein YggE